MNNHFLAEVLAITKKRGSGKAPVISELSVIENGTYEVPSGVDGYNPVIVNVPTGGSDVVPPSGVNFIDYDGSIVQHYSKDEFLSLSDMPSNPYHDGLVAQGWNWSLADAKAYIQKYGTLIVGQMYITDTGDTRIYIHIDEDTPQNRLTFYVRFTSSVADNVDIDWGDGTVETKGSTTATNYPHTYATGGDYVIKLKVNEGTITIAGSGTSFNSGNSIYGSRSNQYSYNRGRIRKVEVGNYVRLIGASAFYNCYSLTSITIPDSITGIAYNAFQNCYSLTSITIPVSATSISDNVFQSCYQLMSIAIPDSVTDLGSSAFIYCYCLMTITIAGVLTSIVSGTFQSCYSLTSIKIPDSVTNIGSSAFEDCYSLTSITIPDSVTVIESAAFQSCYSMSEYHLLPTTPPSLISTSAFNNMPSDCKIYVPYSADHSILAAYQSATNWSTYASHMVEEPQP